MITPWELFLYVLAAGAALIVLATVVLVVFIWLYGLGVKATKNERTDGGTG